MSELASYPKSMQKLVRELTKLPSIGEKSALRLAYHLLSNSPSQIDSLATALKEAKDQIRFCSRCFFFSESEICGICENVSRDDGLLCVVEKPVDVISIERSGEYRGYYHVLHGLWAPLRGIGPESLKLGELLSRLKLGTVREVILAMSATVEGDATALYVAKAISQYGIPSSRLAQGLPKGGELEFADNVTLSHAFNGRKVVNF